MIYFKEIETNVGLSQFHRGKFELPKNRKIIFGDTGIQNLQSTE
jgi:hypothetical protein